MIVLGVHRYTPCNLVGSFPVLRYSVRIFLPSSSPSKSRSESELSVSKISLAGVTNYGFHNYSLTSIVTILNLFILHFTSTNKPGESICVWCRSAHTIFEQIWYLSTLFEILKDSKVQIQLKTYSVQV